MTKHIKHFALLLFLLAGSITAWAAGNDDDAALRLKIHNAIMEVYNKYIEKDPNDYKTLLERSAQQYSMGYLDEALADVNRAIICMPQKEKDLAYEARILRARIYDDKNDLKAELADLNEAIEMNKSSLVGIDMLAKLSYKLGDYKAAEKNYQIILSKQPRNYDAMYGLALVELKRGNGENAIAQVNKAVELYPANTQVYLNRADIMERTANYGSAANNYMLAMTTNDDNGQAIRSLFALSDTHYNDVMDALRAATDQAPGTGLFFRVRSSIALKHEHYGQALKDLETLIDANLMSHAAVRNEAARCAFEICDYDKALTHINKAIEQNNGEPAYFVLKSRIMQQKGDMNAAMQALDEADKAGAGNMAAKLQRARLLIAQKKNKDAQQVLNEAIAIDGSDPQALLLRGWLSKYRLNNVAAARIDFETLLMGKTTMHGLHGFALHELGRDDEARQWAEQIIKDNILPGGEAYAIAAALLSDMDDNDGALKYLESALANGYGSAFEVNVNEAPYVNLKLLRRHPDFATLVSRFPDNFTVK